MESGVIAPGVDVTQCVVVKYESTPDTRRLLRWNVAAMNAALRFFSREWTPDMAHQDILRLRRECYHMCKDRPNRYAAILAAGISVDAWSKIAKYRKDARRKPDTQRPGNRGGVRPALRIHKTRCVWGYTTDPPTLTFRVGSKTHPQNVTIPLDSHAAAILQDVVSEGRWGEPVMNHSTISIPYKSAVPESVARCIIGVDLNRREWTWAKYDLETGAVSSGRIHNETDDATNTYYKNKRAIPYTGWYKHGKDGSTARKIDDRRKYKEHSHRHGSIVGGRREGFMYRFAKWCIDQGAIIILENLTIASMYRRGSGAGPRARDALRGSMQYHKLREVLTHMQAKHGMPIVLVDPHGTSANCPVCGNGFRRHGMVSETRRGRTRKRHSDKCWCHGMEPTRPSPLLTIEGKPLDGAVTPGRVMYCDTCQNLVDRDRAAAANILQAGIMRLSGSRERLLGILPHSSQPAIRPSTARRLVGWGSPEQESEEVNRQ